jgi:hypothetical protein
MFSELSLLHRLRSLEKKPLIIPQIVHLIFMHLFVCKSLQCLVYLALFLFLRQATVCSTGTHLLRKRVG